MPPAAASPAPQYVTWVPYGGTHAVILAGVLLVLAAAFARIGMRIRAPIAVDRPGPVVAAFLVLLWMLAVRTFLIALNAFGRQLVQTHLPAHRPPNPITPFTLLAAVATFAVVCWRTRRAGWKSACAGGFLAAIAAPMIFEFPFDLIVMTRLVPPVPPAPALYRNLFFFPLFGVEFSTLALLTLSPSVRITRGAVALLAAMFGVFALWAALAGFAYPDRPVPFACNLIAKFLCFGAAIELFVAGEDERHTAVNGEGRRGEPA